MGLLLGDQAATQLYVRQIQTVRTLALLSALMEYQMTHLRPWKESHEWSLMVMYCLLCSDL